ncbi:hypothetical protein [Leptospira weilii]|uniref:hypothetical protein n=1 Tax=Leptospira weilii TaxID=28184 RepID=UPI00031ABE23|nr:hypothetical protein [Leptospira weilii]
MKLSSHNAILRERCAEFPLFLGGMTSSAEERGAEFGGGKVREIFLYQKIILLASKKYHSCRNT